MDEIDRAILRLLQADNRRSSAEVAEAVGLSVSSANERMRRLNASGAITANRAIVDAPAVGLDLCAFVFVDLAPRSDEEGFVAHACSRAEVQEVHHVAGAHSYLLKARVAGTAGLQALITVLKGHSAVARTESVVALQTCKETTEIAVPPGTRK